MLMLMLIMFLSVDCVADISEILPFSAFKVNAIGRSSNTEDEAERIFKMLAIHPFLHGAIIKNWISISFRIVEDHYSVDYIKTETDY
jgi:hypothetical protein